MMFIVKKDLSKTKKKLDSAFEKIPELEEPITIYRGVDLENQEGVEIDDIIEDNEYVSPIAESFSMSRKTADGFSGYGKNNGVVLEIRTKKIASPACVSAWGANEYEVLSTPNSRYRVIERVVEEEISGSGNEVTVIRLEEIS